MGNYNFDYSDYEDEMDLDEEEDTNAREENSSSRETLSPFDWWTLDSNGSDPGSSFATGTNLPYPWFSTSSSSEATDSPPADSLKKYEISASSATATSSKSDLGSWVLIPTGSTGLQCGLLAIISSLEHQTDFVITPTLDELSTIAQTGYIGEFIQALGAFGNNEEWDRNFTEDHLDAVLQEYGTLQGIKLRLGVHHAEHGWRTVFGRKGLDEDPGSCVVWIHHDGQDSGSTLGHYSGLTRLE